MSSASEDLNIAVLIPCYNEEATVAKVVEDFKEAFPTATIFVGDNNSTDKTSEIARESGAVVLFEPLQGKGNVVRTMFANIEADVYILVDGDDTYDPKAAPGMLDQFLKQQLDMLVGTRDKTLTAEAYRAGHVLGNRIFTWFVGTLFGRVFSDIFSGYRFFSRRFVKSFPAMSEGFEIESEFTVHALELSMPVAECPTKYDSRPDGSVSKLNTYRDGWRILKKIVQLYKDVHPTRFFGVPFVLLFVASLALGIPVILHFFETGLVPKLPTAVLCSAMMLLAFFSLGCSIILSSVSLLRREAKRLAYLSTPALSYKVTLQREESSQDSDS